MFSFNIKANKVLRSSSVTQYQVTNGEQFLWYDSQREDRILIFSSQGNPNYLQHCNHWSIDDACTTVSTKFVQLYTIHGPSVVKNVADGYYLLPSKQRKTAYINMLNEKRCLRIILNTVC